MSNSDSREQVTLFLFWAVALLQFHSAAMDIWRPIRPGDMFPADESFVGVGESCLALAFRDKWPRWHLEPVFGRAWRDAASGTVRSSFPWGGKEFGNADLGSNTFYLLRDASEKSTHQYVWRGLAGLSEAGRRASVAVERYNPALADTGSKGVFVLGKADIDSGYVWYAGGGKEIVLHSQKNRRQFLNSKVVCRINVSPLIRQKGAVMVQDNDGRAIQVLANDIVAAKISKCLPLDWLVKSGKPPVVGNLGFRQQLKLLGTVSRGMGHTLGCRLLLSTDGGSPQDNAEEHSALQRRLGRLPWHGLRELRLRLGCCGLADAYRLLPLEAMDRSAPTCATAPGDWDPEFLPALSRCAQLESLRLWLRCGNIPRELCLVQSSLRRLCLRSHHGLSLALSACPRLSVLRLGLPEDRSGPKHRLRSRPKGLKLLELIGAASDEAEDFVESADLLGEPGFRVERVQERAVRRDQTGWWRHPSPDLPPPTGDSAGRPGRGK